jgi:hypothetical protein
MNEWYLLLAFIVGMAVGQHLTVWQLTKPEAKLKEKNHHG